MKTKSVNNMREVEIEKIIVHSSGTEEKFDRALRLIEKITNRKVYQAKSKRRIPAFGISPGKKSGCKVTIRNKEEIKGLLERFFAGIDNEIKKKSIVDNHVSFGIKEYIEVPGLDYEREIGILGFEVDIVFSRKGKRVILKKIKQGKYPKRQNVTKEEIIDYLIKNYGVEIE